MGELNSWFAYKVIPQDGQMDNILERILIVKERPHSNDILMMHLGDIESWRGYILNILRG